MTNAMAIEVARKPRRRGLSTRQKASSLYRLWHSIQDIKEDAQHMDDEELALLGTAPDEEVARQTGRTAGAVCQKRCLLGLPTCRDRRRREDRP